MKELFKQYQNIVRYNEPIARYTSFRIGGPAEVFITPKNNEQLRDVYHLCLKNNIPVSILGNGTNLLIKDEGVKGVVIRIASRNLQVTDDIIKVDAGYSLALLVAQGIKSNLTGLEGLAGIPGSVGGGVVMNAGGKYGNASDTISLVRVIDQQGEYQEFKKSQLEFGYRTSNLKDRAIVLEVEFQLKASNTEESKILFQSILAEKSIIQPLSAKSAGCIFKNPAGKITTGQLIEQAGLKGISIGGAMISKKHANYIVNTDNASAQDVLELIERIRETVHQRTGIKLDLEIEVWG